MIRQHSIPVFTLICAVAGLENEGGLLEDTIGATEVDEVEEGLAEVVFVKKLL